MKRALIAGNFKMNKTPKEAGVYARELAKEMQSLPDYQDREVLLCPPYTALYAVKDAVKDEIKNKNIYLGAQNVHNEENGAFTGEISISMLKDLSCSYVILGHSERRHIFKESDAFINAKIKAVLNNDMKAILCVGELIEEREACLANTIVKNQIENGLLGINKAFVKNIIIAYEPVWAIGTGKTATPEDAKAMHVFIRNTLASLFSDKIAKDTIIQYGGSVKPTSINSLMAMDNIDGVLVGGACLEVSSFLEIINFDS